ncbi:PaaI family thioesterase [Piscinibacter gummiphilus]|uniref:PaaI family thioesterase n=1 Tax=Piscinibacter gummiphilus TaxID=946333 RepID=A0ABZ0CV12_9BURK|nr:PaaI family thioesterase [Piscinibacter gummiphilus]WOB08780.1 PaaI family thioesterase [Piscinibacter gummiphilus]
MTPEGYARHTRRSPLTDPWEPLLSRETADSVQLAVEVRDAHCNGRGFAHGGLISALADNAMGLSIVRLARQQPGQEQASAVTVTLALDFLDAARIGEWLEVQPNVLKLGRTLAFAECRVVCGERLIARGNASFRMV